MKSKMYPTKNFQNSFENLPSCITRAMMVVFLLASTHLFIYAQPKLSVQGIVKKSNGEALEDGEYNITYNIYAKDGSPSGILWSETIPDVEVIGGIYSVILGARDTMLSLPFDQDYQLGVKIGTSELLPRIDLTSAPYAFALRGSSNQFPGSGQVLADSMLIKGGTKVNGGILAKQVTADSILVNGGIKVNGRVLSNGAIIQGVLETNQIIINNNGGINYSSTQGNLQDWRLADVDDFSTGTDKTHGWRAYAPAGSGQDFGWNQTNGNANLTNPPYGPFAGDVITTNVGNNMLKKQYNIAGTFSQIKVKFRYYILDFWDFSRNDAAIAGFATAVNGENFKIGWYRVFSTRLNDNSKMNNTLINTYLNFQGTGDTDHWVDAEMTAQANSNTFWVFIGAAVTTTSARYAVGHVEIWVR